ncbi:DUF3280 domain-containing protein [Hansschlegelia beijingensis]|uniref:DUF3280 domain-containing protein n=1 Tax=Hansschlegelia beijingensis TaxID=1133344 RepID=UPI00387F1D4A
MINLSGRTLRRASLGAKLLAAVALAALLGGTPFGAASAEPASPVPVALLSVKMQNDHAEWIPTSDAERDRIRKVEETFRTMLEQSGRYTFKPIDPAMQAEIDKDQALGSCSGCEFRYGKAAGAREVAWIEVQKVSELILNLNVYMADVETGKRVFGKSVDLRGNSDESWRHAIRYLVKNYLLPSAKS